MKKVVWLVLQGNSEGRRGRLKHAGRNENTEVHETLQYPLLYIVDQVLGINPDHQPYGVLQWSPSNPDTVGTGESGPIGEVSSFSDMAWVWPIAKGDDVI